MEKGFKRFEPGREKQKPTIDLIFSAENLLVSAWKRLQEKEGLQYVALHELYDPENDSIENRPQFGIRLPDFVDPTGTRHITS